MRVVSQVFLFTCFLLIVGVSFAQDPLDPYGVGKTLFLPKNITIDVTDRGGSVYPLNQGDIIQIISPPLGNRGAGAATWAYEVRVVSSTSRALMGKNFFTSKKNLYVLAADERTARSALQAQSTGVIGRTQRPQNQVQSTGIIGSRSAPQNIAQCEVKPNTYPIDKRLHEIGSQSAAATAIPVLGNPRIYNSNCSNFINKNGQIGRWGRGLLDAMREVDNGMDAANLVEDMGALPDGRDHDWPRRSCFFDQVDLSMVCPKYKSFSRARIEQLWVFLFTVIAQYESSCRLEPPLVKGSFGKADGLFQLEYDRDLRQGSGRPRRFCSTDREVKSNSLEFQITCAAAIMHQVCCNWGREDVATVNGYWEKLRGNREITQTVKRDFPGCI